LFRFTPESDRRERGAIVKKEKRALLVVRKGEETVAHKRDGANSRDERWWPGCELGGWPRITRSGDAKCRVTLFPLEYSCQQRFPRVALPIRPSRAIRDSVAGMCRKRKSGS